MTKCSSQGAYWKSANPFIYYRYYTSRFVVDNKQNFLGPDKALNSTLRLHSHLLHWHLLFITTQRPLNNTMIACIIGPHGALDSYSTPGVGTLNFLPKIIERATMRA